VIPLYEIRSDKMFGFSCDHLEYPLHLHAVAEFVYAVKGGITVTIDGSEHILRDGELAVIFPHCLHRYDRPPAEADAAPNEILVLGIQTALIGEYADELTRVRPNRPILPAALVPPEIERGMRQLIAQRHSGKYNWPVCRAWAQLMLALLWKDLQTRPHDTADYEDLAYRVSRYLVEHYRQPLSLEETATGLGVSKYQLSRLFSERLHMSFNEHLNRVRISAAQDLLDSTDKPVTDIMYECGFESQTTFNRVFRKACGVSPRHYRERR
jgi:AraC-like DNA-binding protein